MKKLLFALFTTLPILANAQYSGYNINTFAGNGTAAATGDGGSCLLASIDDPDGLAVDTAGNIFVADAAQNNIRKIDPSGIITTYAGTGIAGYSGDGGPANAAKLNGPAKITFDHSGNLLVADFSNNRVRKITPSGVISTIAGSGTSGYSGNGGPATAAQMSGPSGIAVDHSGNIYVCDYSNGAVRKISTTGIITTVVGTGTPGYNGDGIAATSAQLYQTFGVAVDASDNLILADAGNHRIRKVTASGIISTIAGTGTAGSSGDGGTATAAQLNNPAGVTIDSAGNIIVADQFNYRIRVISTSGIIRTIAGNGTMSYSGDSGPATAASLSNTNETATDAHGRLLICDNSNHRVRYLHPFVASVNNIEAKNGVMIYPNPTHDNITIQLTGNYQHVNVRITNTIGQMVYDETVTINASVVAADISKLQPGLYLIQVMNENEVIGYNKIIKQ